MLNLVVFGSGRGSNFVSILEAIERNELHAVINKVIVNNPNAPMIQKAENAYLDVAVIPHDDLTRTQHEQRILDELKSIRVDLICLAGYMRILSKDFIDEVGCPIINIHPSLLPSFPGLHAQQQALEYGVKISGCTVHVVNEEVDSGKILGQIAVPVNEDDTVERLSRRILEKEHILYPKILADIERGKITL